MEKKSKKDEQSREKVIKNYQNIAILSFLVFIIVQMHHISNSKIGPPPILNGLLMYLFFTKKCKWARYLFSIFGILSGVIVILDIVLFMLIQATGTGTPPSLLWIVLDILSLLAYILPLKGRQV